MIFQFKNTKRKGFLIIDQFEDRDNLNGGVTLRQVSITCILFLYSITLHSHLVIFITLHYIILYFILVFNTHDTQAEQLAV